MAASCIRARKQRWTPTIPKVPAAPDELQLRIDLPDEARPNNPVVSILINGDDVLGQLGGGFIGFDPAEVLDSRALIPVDPPRRVAVYRCSCGEAGCACVAPLIVRSGDRVRWTDFRDFTGVYVGPLVDQSPSGGTHHDVPDLEFDADQYLREVDRAAGDRSWETDARKTARLLREQLMRNDEHFIDRGYWRGWVAPHWETPGKYQVDFIGPHGQVVVSLTPQSASLPDQVAEMVQALVGTTPDRWPVKIRNDWPAEQVRMAIDARQRKRAAVEGS